jgi:hypothetical protein
MYIVAVILFSLSLLSIVIFFVIGESDALFAALASFTAAFFVISYRAKVWDEKKVVELELNGYFLLAILFLAVLECLSFYLFIYSEGNNCISTIGFFTKWGKYFILIIPTWIISLILNLKK